MTLERCRIDWDDMQVIDTKIVSKRNASQLQHQTSSKRYKEL
jgi:hypothetical protein